MKYCSLLCTIKYIPFNTILNIAVLHDDSAMITHCATMNISVMYTVSHAGTISHHSPS